MNRILIIGAGAAGSVTAQKCAMDRDIFTQITLASRRLVSCTKIAEMCQTPIETAQVDADNVTETITLIKRLKPDLVINMALPYQDLPIMDACLETGTSYLDTASYEPRDEARFTYEYQWPYHEAFRAKGITAILGCGFDPGVTNAYCAYAQDNLFDTIHTIDIFDCNAGEHGQAFATNFNPEINLREITAPGKYWKDGAWITVPSLSVKTLIDYPGIGPRPSYLLYHEEEESLVRHIRGLRQIRFWMTFSDTYINHVNVLRNVGMLRIDPVMYKGTPVIPMAFLKDVLPEPASLASNYTGKTSIGCIINGIKDNKPTRKMIYNICDHAETFRQVKAQAISYTAGVPPVSGAKLFLDGTWRRAGVFNIEQLPVTPFLDDLARRGLSWHVTDLTDKDQPDLSTVKT